MGKVHDIFQNNKIIDIIKEVAGFTGKSDTEKVKGSYISIKSWIPIKDIKDGIVCLNNGNFIKIIEVTPVNFKLKSLSEKKLILINYKNFLKACNFDMQIVIQSRKTNIDPHLKLMDKCHKTESSYKVREFNRLYCKFVNDFSSKKKSISRRFFIVIPYIAPAGISLNNISFSDVRENLNEKKNKIKEHIRKCGNKVIEHKNEDRELALIYYSFLNLRTSNIQKLDDNIGKFTGISVLNDDTDNRLRKLNNESYGDSLNEGIRDIVDVISPSEIDPSNSNYLLVDNMYISSLLVTNYLRELNADWVDNIVSLNENIITSMYYEKLPKDKVIREITYEIGNKEVTLRQSTGTETDIDDVEATNDDAKYIRKNLSTKGEDIYYLYTYITVYAETLQELNYSLSNIESNLSANHQLRRANFRQEQAYKSVLPFYMNEYDEIKNSTKRNVLTNGLSSSYPLRSSEICDLNGMLLGRNTYNESLAMADLYNTKLFKNANVSILGVSGAGKTYLLQLIAERLRLQGIQVMIVAPLKGHEFEKMCNALDGEFIKISPSSSESCINIFDIRASSFEEEIDEDDFEIRKKKQTSLLAAKIQKLRAFFYLLLPDITNEESQEMDESLIELYKSKGITFDNESLYSNEIGNTISLERKFKTMPLPSDLLNVFKERSVSKRLLTVMKKFVTGSLKNFNNHTNVNLNNSYIVADISEVSKEIMPIAMFTVFDLFWDKVKENPSAKKAFFLDELWKMISAEGSEMAAEFVFEMWKVIRGYGGSAICATQNVKDFFALKDGKYGNAILSNSQIKFILQLDKNDINAINDIIDLSEEETAFVKGAGRGDCLLYAGDNHIAMHVESSLDEEELLCNDIVRLNEIKENKKRMRFD